MFHPTSSRSPTIPSSVSSWKSYSHRIGGDPFTDWATIIATSVILVIVSVVVGVNMYFNVEMTLDQVPEDQFEVAIVKQEVFTQVLADFNDRAQKYSTILHGYTGPRDPSI